MHRTPDPRTNRHCRRPPQAGWLRGARVGLAAACLGLIAATGVQAQPAAALDGERRIVLVAADGTRTEIGTLRFTPSGDGPSSRVAVALHTERFTDHFLSMREFKCLPGGTELTCHVPYPYANPGTVAPGRLGWLEHRLLFFYRKPADFGAKLWNGIYWQLQPTATGWVGKPQAIDLNRIGAPPDKPDEPPYRPALRDDMPADARWFRQLLIE